MACGSNCNGQGPSSSCGCTQTCGGGCNYVCIIVLYILLAIILGSCFF